MHDQVVVSWDQFNFLFVNPWTDNADVSKSGMVDHVEMQPPLDIWLIYG